MAHGSEKFRQTLYRTSHRLGLLSAVGGGMSLVWHLFDSPVANQLLPSVSTSFAALLCGLALARPARVSRTRHSSRISRAITTTVLALAVVTLGLYLLTGFSPGIDQRLVLAPLSSVVLLFAASATLCLQHSQYTELAQGLGFVGLALCLFAITGYIDGTDVLAGLGTSFPMKLSSAFILSTVCVGVLLARPDRGPMAIVTSDTTGGAIARTLFVPLISLPFIANFLVYQIARSNWYSAGSAHAIFTYIISLAIAALVWWQILTLYRFDIRHRGLERQIKRSRDELASLIHSVSDYAICKLDPGGRIRSWNTGAQQLTGFEADEVLGQPSSIFFCSEDIQKGTPERLLAEAKQAGRSTSKSWRRRKDGSEFCARTVITRMDDSQGKLRGFAEVTQDVTAGHEAEENLARLQSILHTVEDPILVIDETGLIELFNPAAEKAFGYKAEEILLNDIGLLIPESQVEQRERDVVFHPTALRQHLLGSGHQVTAVRKDGSTFPAEVTVSEMLIQGRKKFTGIIRDITARRASEDAVRCSEARLSLALEAGNIGVWNMDIPRGEIIVTGPLYNQLPVEREKKSDVRRWLAIIHPDDLPLMKKQSVKIAEGKQLVLELEYRVRTRDENWRWVYSRGTVSSKTQEGLPVLMHGTTVDIHQRKTAEDALRKNKLDLEMALKDAAFHLWHFNLSKYRVEDIESLVESLGYPQSDQTHTPAFWMSVLHPEDREMLLSLPLLPLPSELTGSGMEIRLRCKDGSWRWMVARARVVETDRDGTPQLITGTCADITDRKHSGERLLQAAQHDSLTGLPNRSLTYAFGDRLVAASPRHGNQCAVLFVDLDRFKPINDSYGHAAGDAVLREVARRLRHCVREEDVVGRLGGDEFLIALAEVHGPEDIVRVANDCLAAVNRPILYQDMELRVSPSIGISLFPDDGENMETLVKHADVAMYHAKQGGRSNFVFFTPSMHGRTTSLLKLESRLRKAVEQETFSLSYQPVVDLEAQRVIGVEALLRWPEENIGPEDFIQIAESNGLILPLGEWVLRQACRQHRLWTDRGLHSLRISVNVSPLQFRQKGFVDQVVKIVKETGIGPAHLQLEVTESALVHDLGEVIRMLGELRHAGIRIALDDFGKGYSSLNYLKELPLDAVKIDKDFVLDLQTDRINLAITEAILRLGDSLGLDVIAEGIETEGVLQLLHTKHCKQMQGFYLSRPMPADDFERWYHEPYTTKMPASVRLHTSNHIH